MSFEIGERVRVADRPHEGHHRTPGYVKGKTGVVAQAHAAFLNPETRAYGSDGRPAQVLYRVAFEQRELWPDYAGSEADRIYVDVFEHWLDPAA